MNEHTELRVEEYSYQKYLWDLLKLAHNHQLTVEIIGHETSEMTGIIYPMHRLMAHPNSRENICIVAGIHGNEIAGPLSILRLLECFLHQFPAEFRYIIYPVINPSGFDLRQRYDDDGRDLNAIYNATLKSKNYQEVQAFYEDAQKFSPYEAVLTLHEDSDLEKFYMYGLGKENIQFYHAVCAFAKMMCPAWENAEIYGFTSDEFGLVHSNARDHAFDAALYHQGKAKVALTLETPGKLDINFRSNMMAQLVLHCLHLLSAKNYMEPFCSEHRKKKGNISPIQP